MEQGGGERDGGGWGERGRTEFWRRRRRGERKRIACVFGICHQNDALTVNPQSYISQYYQRVIVGYNRILLIYQSVLLESSQVQARFRV